MEEEDGLDSLDIDQESAKRLRNEGCFFILLDFPIGSSIGIDMSDYSVGEKFRGFKMIPPGLHFIHYSAVNSKDYRQTAPRTGFFKFFAGQDVMVLRWNQESEDISEEPVSMEEIDRIKSNLFGSLDQFLAPYPFKEYQRWISLTDHISQFVLNTLNPESGKINSVPQLISLRYPEDIGLCNQTSLSPNLNADNLLPKMRVEPNSQIKYSSLEQCKYPKGSSPSEVTKHCIDSSYCLNNLIKRFSKKSEILGELQFAFATFIAGQVYDSFEHWKALLRVFCKSEQALVVYPELYLDFISVLHFQLKEVPEDMFVDIIEGNNFLVSVLRDFFYNILTTDGLDEKLKRRALNFQENVTNKYKWNFEADLDDEAPVLVELA